MQITVDTRELRRLAERTLPEIGRRVPAAQVRAINASAGNVRTELRAEMREQFDAPTPFILRSLFVRRARQSTMTAEVVAGGIAGQVLAPHVYGGTRPMRKSEQRLGSYVLPAEGAPLDRYGNVPSGYMARVVGALTQGARNVFFRDGTTIYERKGATVTPVLQLIQQPFYPVRLQWADRAAAVMSKTFVPHFERSFDQAIQRAKRRAAA